MRFSSWTSTVLQPVVLLLQMSTTTTPVYKYCRFLYTKQDEWLSFIHVKVYCCGLMLSQIYFKIYLGFRFIHTLLYVMTIHTYIHTKGYCR